MLPVKGVLHKSTVCLSWNLKILFVECTDALFRERSIVFELCGIEKLIVNKIKTL